MEQSIDGKISEAKRLKDAGNEFFKANDYKKALGAYHQANLFITGLHEKGSQYYAYSKESQLDETQAKHIK